jgi:hypothetical protein
LALDSLGNLYVADYNNHRIRKVTPEGVVTTLAGSGVADYADGTGTNANIGFPSDMVIDTSGNLFIITGTVKLRKLNIQTGTVTTYTNYGYGSTLIYSLAINNSTGDLYVGGGGGIFKVTPQEVVSVFAGSAFAGSAFAAGTGTNARLADVQSLSFDSSGNLYAAALYSSIPLQKQRILIITSSAVVSSYLDGSSTLNIGPPGVTSQKTFQYDYHDGIAGIAFDSNGIMYFTSNMQNVIRRKQGVQSVDNFSGTGTGAVVDGPVSTAQYATPMKIIIGPDGTMFVSNSHCIRKITAT